MWRVEEKKCGEKVLEEPLKGYIKYLEMDTEPTGMDKREDC